MTALEYTLSTIINDLRRQLAAQRAIVAADDELHRRAAVDFAVGPSVEAAWRKAIAARAEAKTIDEGGE